MSTVKEVTKMLADGVIPLYEAVNDFARRDFARPPRLTREQRGGAHDIPPPDDNSFDWVDLTPGLSEMQREHLRRAYDKANA